MTDSVADGNPVAAVRTITAASQEAAYVGYTRAKRRR